MERVMGIEPTLSAWEADVLPLNYTRTLDVCDIAKEKNGGADGIRTRGLLRDRQAC